MPILDRRINQFIEDQDTRVSVGIDFPFARVPNQDGYFKTTKSTIEALKNNIRLLLQTEQGERVFQPNLGMNLKRFLFEQITEDTAVQIENDIVIMMETWMPFVEIRDLQVNVDPINQDQNKINVQLVFNIKRSPAATEMVEITFDEGVIGGVSDGGTTGGTDAGSGPSGY